MIKTRRVEKKRKEKEKRRKDDSTGSGGLLALLRHGIPLGGLVDKNSIVPRRKVLAGTGSPRVKEKKVPATRRAFQEIGLPEIS